MLNNRWYVHVYTYIYIYIYIHIHIHTYIYIYIYIVYIERDIYTHIIAYKQILVINSNLSHACK